MMRKLGGVNRIRTGSGPLKAVGVALEGGYDSTE